MKELKIMNRTQAIKYSYKYAHHKEWQGQYAIISISEVADKKPRFQLCSRLKGVCYVWFDDVEKTDDRYIAISQKEAKQIADFIKTVIDEIDIMVVHCLAGRSRSSAVAAAIFKWKYNDDSEIFKQYTPNMKVYRMVLEELMQD